MIPARRSKTSSPMTQALSRPTGGVEDPDAPDQASTTGTTPKGEYVGRIAGDDVGYAGGQGADRRAALAEEADDEDEDGEQ